MTHPSGVPESYASHITLTEEEIQVALTKIFGADVKPASIEERVKAVMQEIEDEVSIVGKMKNPKVTSKAMCRWLVAELRAVTEEKQIEAFLPVIAQLRGDMLEFISYASLLEEYAERRRKDLLFDRVDEEMDEEGDAYLELSESDLDGRRILMDRMKKGVEKRSADSLTWAGVRGPRVRERLREEHEALSALEKKKRATDRLKREISPKAILMKESIDEIKKYQELEILKEMKEKFGGFVQQRDRTYLQRYAQERLEVLLEDDAKKKGDSFKERLKSLSREKNKKKAKKMREKIRTDLREACSENFIFNDYYNSKWVKRLQYLTPTPRKGISCTRVALFLVLTGGVTAAVATFDQWKKRFGFNFSSPPVKAPETPGADVAPPSSETQTVPKSGGEKERKPKGSQKRE